MNEVEKMFTAADDVGSFAKAYFAHLSNLLNTLDSASIETFMAELEKARIEGRTIFIAGNGGSAATASHMCNDFGSALYKAGSSESPLRTISLTDNTPYITMVGNDYGYECIFTKQLEMLYTKGDTLIVISASGNSPNVVMAAEWVKTRGGQVLGLLGFDGGKLKQMCDVSIVLQTEKGEYGPVEDAHMILDHVFTHWMQLTYAAATENNEGK